MNIGIIGTAARGNDADKINKNLFYNCLNSVFGIICKYGKNNSLVSGGAAFADHIAVVLALKYNAKLTLHLPAEFVDGEFRQTDNILNPGRVSNFYHRKFSKQCKFNSFQHLHDVIYHRNTTTVIVTPGFKERNTKVAQDADVLIALTFGEKNKVKDGGTADTAKKYLNLGKKHLWHIDLNTMVIYESAIV